MEARGKIYIISHITGTLRYFRHGPIILKITLWRMMRAAEENSSTHSKKRLGTDVGSPGNKIKNECVSTDESQKLTPLLLYLNARTCAPMRNTYWLRDRRSNPQKIKMWSVRNERLSLASRNVEVLNLFNQDSHRDTRDSRDDNWISYSILMYLTLKYNEIF